MAKTAIWLLLLGFPALSCFPSDFWCFQEKEKAIIIEPVKSGFPTVALQVNLSPKFTFLLGKDFRIRKTEKAAMYEYEPQKPSKPYRHLMIFLELLERGTKTKLPKIDVVVVTEKEFIKIVETNGFVWIEPQIDATAKQKGGRLLWLTEGETLRVFMMNFKEPERVLTLEQFLTHLALLTEWELSVRNANPGDAEDLADKREEEWGKQERKALILFGTVSGHWRLLQLDWPPIAQSWPKLSIPLPWPPWLRHWSQ